VATVMQIIDAMNVTLQELARTIDKAKRRL
jgi:hypothetical protein